MERSKLFPIKWRRRKRRRSRSRIMRRGK